MNTVNVKKVGNYYIYTSDDSILGSGTQAIVYLAKRSTDNLHLAAKVFDITQNFNEKDLESIRRQLDILFTTKHPYILNCYDFIQTKNNIYMFSEYCDGGDLLNYINNRQFISESECLDIFKQIVSALQVLDKNNIAHRDLKTANILLSGGQVKLADFGFAKRIQPNNKSILNTYVGSPIFMSPQALIGGAYDLKKSDVWSAGICLYYMLFKAYPFNSKQQDLDELKLIVANTPLAFPELPKRSKQVKELLTKMLEKDEQKRYDLNQVANHECLTYSSSTNVNPLLRSSEINQVTGISSFNPNLKEQALVQGKAVPPQNIQSMDFASRQPLNNLDNEQIRQGQEIFLNQIDTNKNIINLHNLVMLFASLPQKHTEIWKSIKKYAVDGLLQHLGDNIEEARQALVLLMVTLYLLARREMEDTLNQTREKVTKAIIRLLNSENQKKNNEQLLTTYFNQENYKCLMRNMRVMFMQGEDQHANQQKELLNILREERFSYSLEEIQNDLEGILDLVFYNLQDYLNNICNTAVQNNNKPILNLLANIYLMRLYEIKVRKELFDFKTYYELIQSLESINFMSAAQLNDKIQEIRGELKKYEDDDEDDG